MSKKEPLYSAAKEKRELLRRIKKMVEKIKTELRQWWKFGEGQEPISSWHDREDFLATQIDAIIRKHLEAIQ